MPACRSVAGRHASRCPATSMATWKRVSERPWRPTSQGVPPAHPSTRLWSAPRPRSAICTIGYGATSVRDRYRAKSTRPEEMMRMSDPTENHDDPGDLSRRVAARRKALGLDIEEVAKRAGMHPAYLEYLEHHARARPTPAACARLASALETSVAWLRGAGVGLPPGHARPPTGIPRLLELEPGTCLQLLQAGGVGRAVFVDERGVPTALPVNFRVIDGDIVFRTGEGAIARAVRTGKPLSIEV